MHPLAFVMWVSITNCVCATDHSDKTQFMQGISGFRIENLQITGGEVFGISLLPCCSGKDGSWICWGMEWNVTG
ncbi:hypothetical protein CEXT_80961 [Caerostris extrusa]|uniref:Uncharacterized protein n=1 Tax=Caerostris extrusa TaxID=172846 RepID=A0AAV4M648_CAEEX|nr:hypothetical protein CEXT_80961 [Caerostris extrusa]